LRLKRLRRFKALVAFTKADHYDISSGGEVN